MLFYYLPETQQQQQKQQKQQISRYQLHPASCWHVYGDVLCHVDSIIVAAPMGQHLTCVSVIAAPQKSLTMVALVGFFQEELLQGFAPFHLSICYCSRCLCMLRAGGGRCCTAVSGFCAVVVVSGFVWLVWPVSGCLCIKFICHINCCLSCCRQPWWWWRWLPIKW